MLATKNGHIEVVKILIDQNADVDKVDKFDTAIMLAIREGHNDIVKLLLGKGANVNLTNKWGDTALSNAVFADKEDSVEVVKLLLEKGALPDSRHGDNDKTLLQIIAEKEIHTAKDLIIAKLLLQKGANLEKIDKQSKLYPLLKIIGNLADDEIKVVANHLEDFKVISNGILMYKSFSEKESGPIQELTNDTMSKILIESFPTNLREVFEKDLISKLVNNLLEIYSREEREKREANSLLLAPTLSPPTPPVQDEQPSGSPGCFSCIRIAVAKMLGSNSGIDRQ
jgi:ankyrin repeat protein